MLFVVIGFLCLSILLYLLMGGADFGAGIIELFSKSTKERTRLLTYQAIGPVWEANHMWLIITIVILFVGFPTIYTTLSTFLHIPLAIMLLGIIARGTAFIFRHYDAVEDGMQNVYNAIFVYSSFVTPLFLGIIAGTVISGRIDLDAQTFQDAYLLPWLHPFPIAVGLFTACICGFLAAVFLVGEAKTLEDRKIFAKKANIFNILTVIAGGLVFLTGFISEIDILFGLLTNMVSFTAIALATFSLVVLWHGLRHKKKVLTRITAGFQVTMVLFALGNIYLPDFVLLKGGATLSLTEHAALGGPIDSLGWALLIGSVFILPFLVYLIYSFQKKPLEIGANN